MLKVIKNDENRDVVIKSGRFVFIYDLEAAAQVIDNTIRVQLGEYQYSQTTGVDYLNNAFLGNPNYQRFEAQVRSQVLNLSFVEKVSNFEYTLTESILTYSMTVQTIYGTTSISG